MIEKYIIWIRISKKIIYLIFLTQALELCRTWDVSERVRRCRSRSRWPCWPRGWCLGTVSASQLPPFSGPEAGLSAGSVYTGTRSQKHRTRARTYCTLWYRPSCVWTGSLCPGKSPSSSSCGTQASCRSRTCVESRTTLLSCTCP